MPNAGRRWDSGGLLAGNRVSQGAGVTTVGPEGQEGKALLL